MGTYDDVDAFYESVKRSSSGLHVRLLDQNGNFLLKCKDQDLARLREHIRGRITACIGGLSGLTQFAVEQFILAFPDPSRLTDNVLQRNAEYFITEERKRKRGMLFDTFYKLQEKFIRREMKG